MGYLQYLVSDNGPQISKIIKRYCEEHDIEQIYSSMGTPSPEAEESAMSASPGRGESMINRVIKSYYHYIHLFPYLINI